MRTKTRADVAPAPQPLEDWQPRCLRLDRFRRCRVQRRDCARAPRRQCRARPLDDRARWYHPPHRDHPQHL